MASEDIEDASKDAKSRKHGGGEKLRSILLFTAGSLFIINQGRELGKKIVDAKSNEPKLIYADIPAHCIPHDTNRFPQPLADIIKKKGGYARIPHHISYNKKEDIDINAYDVSKDSALYLRSFESDLGKISAGIGEYCARDYKKYEPLLHQISSKWVGITPDESYRDKVAKIQSFVFGFVYEHDLLYLGKNLSLPTMSDYQMPTLANLLIKKMDCNNKAGLFIELCRANGILSGIGSSHNHVAPIVFCEGSDMLWSYIKADVSCVDRTSYKLYKGIIIDPTRSDNKGGKGVRPHIAGDTYDNAIYEGMQFSVFWPQ